MNQENPWDHLEGADNSAEREDGFMATVHVEPWFCVLQKGVGKVPYDPAVHDISQRQVALTIRATTDRAEIVREFLSWDAGWKQFAASCERAGVFPQHFKEPQRARVRFAEVLDKSGNPQVFVGRDGVAKTRTTIEIVELLPETEPASEASAPINAPTPNLNAGPGADQRGPRNATERVAFAWLAQAAGRSADGVTPEDLVRGLGALTQKPAVRSLSAERWAELAEAALIAAGKAPF